MELQAFKQYLVALLLLGFCGSGWAVVYPIDSSFLPPGATVAADDESELFTLGDSVWNFEVLDRSEGLDFAFEFGYYFPSDPSTLISIFGKTTPDINQMTVNIGSTDPIGFYLQFDAYDPFNIPATTLFTQAGLNTAPPGQTETDWAGAYPVLTAPAPITTDFYLLAFFYPVPPPLSDNRVIPVYLSVAGPSPISPIPLPGAIFLWMTGLAGVALFRRRLAAGSPVTATAVR